MMRRYLACSLTPALMVGVLMAAWAAVLMVDAAPQPDLFRLPRRAGPQQEEEEEEELTLSSGVRETKEKLMCPPPRERCITMKSFQGPKTCIDNNSCIKPSDVCCIDECIDNMKICKPGNRI
ncbi:uncharacterized protein [Procambarus clarkii]|uniref:uncharacterized protein isoform X1 n=1 Tax=Procambarus clarkii TaxID=6728 RepID=UPI003742AC72